VSTPEPSGAVNAPTPHDRRAISQGDERSPRLLQVPRVAWSAVLPAAICPIPKLIVQAGEMAVGMRAEGARVQPGLRSGDGPLSVRARPSRLKRDCARRATSTGGKCLVNASREVTLDPGVSTGTPIRRQGPGGSLPGPGAGHPLHGAGSHPDRD
jgi:hypothetical protein